MSLLRVLLAPLFWLRAIFFVFNIFFASILHTLTLIPIYPLKFISPTLYVTIECFLHSKAGETFIPVFTLFPKLKIYSDTLSDLEPITRKRAMMMVNHQDSGDVPMMMCIGAYFGLAHTTTWIVDEMFKWTPFGVPSQWHNDFFSREGNKEVVVKRLKQHFSTTYFDRGLKWLIFFPEGGYLKNRGERARNWAARNNLPVLYNCVLPRTTAFIAITQAFRGEVKAIPEQVEDIVDVTLFYKGPRDLCMTDILMGSYLDTEVYAHFRTYKMCDLPKEELELQTWLYDRYQEKEDMITRFKENGEFKEGNSFSQIHQSPGRLLGSLVFWYITAFFVYDLYKTMFRHLLSITSGFL
ncbi:acyl-CoA:lysophosphatidylglycerol acyltransferase 1-like [Bolinopsis microptera]|uniref:acyl-CoA:lysophosphatidylglycerol acyltransferase 1-like n=1 Tax=Bolinopsis microptera TaxID=2820187 RepID=UPI003079E107